MKLSQEQQKKLAVVLPVTALIIVVLWYLVISKQNAAMAAGGKKIAEISAKLDSAKRIVNSEARAMEELAARTNELAGLEVNMASGNDKYYWFISTLNNFKVPYQNQVEIPHVSRETVTEIKGFPNFPYKGVAFSIRGSAHFHNFGRFLVDFENKFPFFRVQKLVLSPAPPDMSSDAEKISFEMEIVVPINPNSP